jgi:hypothetical protein
MDREISCVTVFGGTGFVGRRVARHLRASGAQGRRRSRLSPSARLGCREAMRNSTLVGRVARSDEAITCPEDEDLSADGGFQFSGEDIRETSPAFRVRRVSEGDGSVTYVSGRSGL